MYSFEENGGKNPWNLDYKLQEYFWIWLKAIDPEIKKSSGNV